MVKSFTTIKVNLFTGVDGMRYSTHPSTGSGSIVFFVELLYLRFVSSFDNLVDQHSVLSYFWQFESRINA